MDRGVEWFGEGLTGICVGFGIYLEGNFLFMVFFRLVWDYGVEVWIERRR